MGFDDLSNVLWQERRILEMLVFKLEEKQLILISGRHHWLTHATAEVEQVLESIRIAEDARMGAVDELIAELGLAEQPTLGQLADAAPDPWRDILRLHRASLLAAFARVQQASARNKEILAHGLAATADALKLLGQAPVAGYDANGTRPAVTSNLRLLNSSL